VETRNGGLPRIGRRLLTAAAAVTMTGTALVAASETPAAAAVTVLETAVARAYTDSAHPSKSYVDGSGPLPVGAWTDADGGKHKSRTYFTFDLSKFFGKRILGVTGLLGESSVNDCTAPRSMQIWRTDTATSPTWERPPRELAQVGVPVGAGCPASHMEVDLTNAISQAVANRVPKLTFVARNPDGVEGKVAYGRRITDLRLSVEYNTPPEAPTQVWVETRPCPTAAPPYIPATQPVLAAVVTDADPGDVLNATFAVWPVDHPDQRTELAAPASPAGTSVSATVPEGLLREDVVYAFSVRTNDAYDTSAWTPECRFLVDNTSPDRAPGVSSPQYPEDQAAGGVGIAGTFTFTANGVPDVVGYRWGRTNPPVESVAADTVGGSATITWTPTESGPARLFVQSVDRSGRTSPIREYRFSVPQISPIVEDGNPTGGIGEPRVLTFRPRMANVVAYLYTFGGDPEQTVPADADGVATVTVTPTTGQTPLSVRSRTADGVLSPPTDITISVDVRPLVSSAEYPPSPAAGGTVGDPGTFTFTARQPNAVAFVYSVNSGPLQTVPVGPDGTANISWTPTGSGMSTLTVRTRDASGAESGTSFYYFDVRSNTPEVTSAEYPEWGISGGPGVTGTFTFQASQTGASEFVYSFNGGPEQTVAAGPDGTASITWTPTTEFDVTLVVYSRRTDGSTSEGRYYFFLVNQ
jgi:hypothetical protein